MADWDQLREVGHEASPPPFESLVATAARRDRRARIAAVAATAVLVAGVAIGVGVGRGDDGIVQPAGDPSHGQSDQADTTLLPDGVLALPEPEGPPGHPALDTARYRIPLSDTLAFEVDLPSGTFAHADGLYLASREIVLKVEVAGEQYGVPRDPCTDQAITPVGPTVDDLVRAVRDESAYRVSRPTSVELAGAQAIRFEMRLRSTYDTTSCEEGRIGLPGNRATRDNAPAGYLGHWHVLEVHGQRVVIHQFCEVCTAGAADRMTSVVRSISFIPTG